MKDLIKKLESSGIKVVNNQIAKADVDKAVKILNSVSEIKSLLEQIQKKGLKFFSALNTNSTDNVYINYLIANESSKWESYKTSSFDSAYILFYALAGDISEFEVDNKNEEQFLGSPNEVDLNEVLEYASSLSSDIQTKIIERLSSILLGKADFYSKIRYDQ